MSSGIFLQLISVDTFGTDLTDAEFVTLRICPLITSSTETHCALYPVYRDMCSQVTIYVYKSY